MRNLSRRRLLRLVGTMGLGLAAGACTRADQEPTATSTLAPAVSPTEPLVAPAQPSAMPTLVPPTAVPAVSPISTAAATLAPPSPTPAPPEAADVAVVRGEDPEALVRRALEALGGIGRFVQPGYDVIIKPNICNANHGPEYASTTHPLVVATLVRLCRDAGADRVRVMDNPFAGTAERAYEISGIGEAVAAAGGEMEIMAPHRFQDADIPRGLDITSWPFYKPILDADLVINVPIAKHHSLARLTLGGKNIMGCIENRGGIHRNLGQRIADIVSRVSPQLTVIDATRILVANGPTGGNLADVQVTNTLIASQDIVAADAYATGLFGLRPEDVGYIGAAHAMGLGSMDLSALRVTELTL